MQTHNGYNTSWFSEDAVVMSLDYYNSLMGNGSFVKISANAWALLRQINLRQYKNGKTAERDLIDE